MIPGGVAERLSDLATPLMILALVLLRTRLRMCLSPTMAAGNGV